jgi:lambda family phage tail tape measure protein
MADLTYDVRVNTQQAEANLGKLQRSVSGLNDTFVRFKSTLATISLGAVISQSLQFADAISDLSDASDIAIGSILGFSKAVEANGGSSDGAQKAILRLVNSIGEAADGSAAMQQAFRDVGVTINDLRNASNEEILKKTIDGLDKMENSAKRSVLITQLLGKEFRNVASGQLGAAYAEASAKSAQYADAVTKGAAAQQNIDKTLGDLKLGLLEAIKPFSDFASKINVGVESFQRFVQALLAVGLAFASLFAIRKVFALFVLLIDGAVALYGVLTNLGTFLVELANGWRVLYAATEGAGGAVLRIWMSIKAVGAVLTGILGPAFTVIGSIATPVLAGIAGYWGWIQDSTGAAIDKLREYASALTFGLISPPSGGGAGRGDAQAEMARRKKDAEEAAKKEKALREVLDRQAEARGKARLETNQQIENMAIGLSRQTEAIWNDTRLVELSKLKNLLSDDEVEILKAQGQASVERLAALKKLEQEEEKLRFQLKYAKDEDKAGIRAQIQGNEELTTKTKEYYDAHDTGLRETITYQQTVNKLVAARRQDEDNLIKSIEAQISRQQLLGDTIRNTADQQKDLNFASSLKGLSPLQREIAQTRESARKAALEAARAYAAAFEDSGDGLTMERARELTNGLNAIYAAYKNIGEAQVAALGSANELTNGLSSAWNDYKTKAIDTAGQIKSSFENLTSGLEDAFVKFVQGGKLSFSDLANSILADLARIAFKKAVVFAAGLFGFANGGSVMGGVPVVVGERGPELFVPQSAGKIVANNQLGGSGASSAPAPSNVVYNIQAVDAASFRSLVARDPSFIYAVTEQGRRSQPTRRAG